MIEKLRTEIWLRRNLLSRKTKSALLSKRFTLKVERNFVFHVLAVNKFEYYRAASLCIKSLSDYIKNPEVILHTDREGALFFEKESKRVLKTCRLQIKVLTDSAPWQYSKIRIISESLGNEGVFVDADLFWNGAIPVFTETTFYVKEIGKLQQQPYRRAIESTFPKLSSSDMINTSLVFLGELAGNLQFKKTLDEAYETILDFATNRYHFHEPNQKLIRLAEQIAVTIAVHSTVSSFQTLKSLDSPFDGGIAESYYLGTTRKWS